VKLLNQRDVGKPDEAGYPPLSSADVDDRRTTRTTSGRETPAAVRRSATNATRLGSTGKKSNEISYTYRPRIYATSCRAAQFGSENTNCT